MAANDVDEPRFASVLPAPVHIEDELDVKKPGAGRALAPPSCPIKPVGGGPDENSSVMIASSKVLSEPKDADDFERGRSESPHDEVLDTSCTKRKWLSILNRRASVMMRILDSEDLYRC